METLIGNILERRRPALEPVMGHLKSEHRMGREYALTLEPASLAPRKQEFNLVAVPKAASIRNLRCEDWT